MAASDIPVPEVDVAYHVALGRRGAAARKAARADEARRREVDFAQALLEEGERLARIRSGTAEPADVAVDVMRELAQGKPLQEALRPARPFAAVALVGQLADESAQRREKAALTILEWTDGKPVQPIRQDGPIVIEHISGALAPPGWSIGDPIPVEGDWEPVAIDP